MISTIHAFDPLFIEVSTRSGAIGMGECVIVPGYSHELPETSWSFCVEQAGQLVGQTLLKSIEQVRTHEKSYSHAVSILVAALEMAHGHPLLQPATEERRVALVAPLHSKEFAQLSDEIELRVSEGFGVLKVKVGQNVRADLSRTAFIQSVVAGRAKIRLDANQGFSPEDGCRFASSLDPYGIELLEQPCAAEDWEAAIRVKEVSKVPMMLDESIFDEEDIERAAKSNAAEFVKLKLVKMSGLTALKSGLDCIAHNKMGAILGNGVATDINNWMEACASVGTLETAGEMNGFLKSSVRLFRNPLLFDKGNIVLPAGYIPELDRAVLDRCTRLRERFS